MRIGEVAESSGLPARTIRFYERLGLLPEPARAANGYRRYNASALDRLAFIRGAQRAGLTLAEIGGVVTARESGSAPCSHVVDLLAAKLEDVARQREQLNSLEGELRGLLDRSRRLDPADCTDRAVCHILQPHAKTQP